MQNHFCGFCLTHVRNEKFACIGLPFYENELVYREVICEDCVRRFSNEIVLRYIQDSESLISKLEQSINKVKKSWN